MEVLYETGKEGAEGRGGEQSMKKWEKDFEKELPIVEDDGWYIANRQNQEPNPPQECFLTLGLKKKKKSEIISQDRGFPSVAGYELWLRTLVIPHTDIPYCLLKESQFEFRFQTQIIVTVPIYENA